MADKKPEPLEYDVPLDGGETITIRRWPFRMYDVGLGCWAAAQHANAQGNAIAANMLIKEMVLQTLDTDEDGLEKICSRDGKLPSDKAHANYLAIRDAVMEHDVKPLIDRMVAETEAEGGDASPPASDASPKSAS